MKKLFLLAIACITLACCSKRYIEPDLILDETVLKRHVVNEGYYESKNILVIGYMNNDFPTTRRFDMSKKELEIRTNDYINVPLLNIFYYHKKWADGKEQYIINDTKPIVLYVPTKSYLLQ